MTKIIVIAAMAKNRAIGMNGAIPWDIPEDLQRFRALTKGHPCIMGRKTFESIIAKLGRPLPGRTSIIISRSDYCYDKITVCKTFEDALNTAQSLDNTIYICGGAAIYALALPHATHLSITEIDLEPIADAFMPVWDVTAFTLTHQENHDGPPSYRFLDYHRK